MPAQIVQGQIVITGSSEPNAYVQILNPTSYIRGASAGNGGVCGSASWGPVNTPLYTGSPNDVISSFGPEGVLAADLASDMVTDALLFYQQAAGAGIGLWMNRVTDGSDLKATCSVPDTTAPATGPLDGVNLTALYSGVLGNGVTIAVAQGTKGANFFTTTISGLNQYGIVTEVYPNLAGSAGATSTYWANILAAINTGISGVRGPSKIVSAALGVVASLPPAIGSVILGTTTTLGSGKTAFVQQAGTNGTATNATLVTNQVGSAVAVPATGIFALRNLTPGVNVAWLSGMTTQSNYVTIQAYADAEGALVFGALPTGTSTTTTLTNRAGVSGYTIDDPNFVYLKDFDFFNDVQNKTIRSVAPYAVAAGRICSLPPWISPLNKPVFGILGTERNNPNTGNIPYSASETGSLNGAGVTFIGAPCPGGAYNGFKTAVNSSSDSTKSPIEYATMTNFLAKSFGNFIGQYIGQNQSTSPQDPLRQQVRQTFNTFLLNLKQQNAIDSFSVVCDLTNNSPSTIAQHFMYCQVNVKYLASVWYFLVSLTGGTTVNVALSQ